MTSFVMGQLVTSKGMGGEMGYMPRRFRLIHAS